MHKGGMGNMKLYEANFYLTVCAEKGARNLKALVNLAHSIEEPKFSDTDNRTNSTKYLYF